MKKYRLVMILAAVVLLIILGQARGFPALAPSTPTLSVALGQAEMGPRIVKQSPIEGERLPLAPVLELTFDRDMNPTATGDAWSFSDSAGQSIPGKVTWPDARTLRFEPDAPLKASADYAAAIAPSAAALDGSSPAAEIRLKFRTVDPLAVGQVFPADGAAEVEVNSTVTVIFNRPIVTLTDVEDSLNKTVPVVFSPSIAGHGEWMTTSVYVFTPDGYLPNGTAYTATVAAGLKDFTGESLAKDFVWHFATRAPRIANFSLKNGLKNPTETIPNVLLDQAFVVTFLQPMNTESAAKALSLTDRNTGKAFPVQLEWDDAKMILTIKPVGMYKVGGQYHLILASTAEAAGGGRLQEGLDIYFSTVPLPRILKVTPDPLSSAGDFDPSLSIAFSTPMNFNSLKGKVIITPAPAEAPQWYYSESEWTLNMYGLEPGTDYFVRVLPGMADIYGHVIPGEYSFSFRTGDLRPYAMLMFPGEPLIYRAKGEQNYFFEYINLDSASIALYPLSIRELGRIEEKTEYATPLNGVVPASSPIRTWTPDLHAEKNALARLKIPLQDGDGQPLTPGYYFIGLKAEPFKEKSVFHQGAVFIVATDNITFKVTGNEALAWVTDLETGRPAAGVELALYNQAFVELGRATTDSDGVASWTGVTGPYFAAASSGGHVAFASQDWGSGVSQNDVGMWQVYYRNPQASFSYVYTDRPLYRPGQSVEFTGVVRAEDDLQYTLPTLHEAYVTIEYEGEQVFAQTIPLSDLGSFAGSYALGSDIPLGSYTVLVRVKPDSDVIGYVTFRVADYHKPEFQVAATADKTDISPGEKVSFDLKANYYSGGKVSNASVSWFLEFTPFYFYPPAAYQGFSFTDWDRDSGLPSSQTGGKAMIAEGNGVMDADGHFTLSQVIGPAKTKGDWVAVFSANVTDVTGSIVSGSVQVVMHQSLVYAGIRSASYVGRAGEEQTFELVVLDWNGKPVADQIVSVQIVERRWYSVQEQDAKGQLRWVTTVKDIPAASFPRVVTDSSGQAKVAFTPAIGGVYKALVTVRDSKGDTQQASTYLWITSDSYVPWQQTNDRSFNLIPDKTSYEPGETAEILLAQPFAGEVYALVTWERGHIHHREVIKLSGNSTVYRLPITEEMAPVEYLSVVVFTGAKANGVPDFRMGVVRINVNTTRQALDVRVTADRQTAGPGDTVTYTVVTRDDKGNPVPAEVSWALVDKAVLALTPSNVTPILDAFYPFRALGVRTSVGVVWDADDYLANLKPTNPNGAFSGSGGGGKGEGDLGIVTVRQDFKDTAFFRAQTITGADGKAQVTVTLPENLTTWQMTVRAVTADSRVGEAIHELTSSKPLYIQLQTPRFFVAGDSARIGAAIHNNTALDLAVRVSLEAEGVSIDSPAEQEVDVPAGQTASVFWNVSVKPGAQRVDLIARAEGGGFTDASKPPLGTLSDQGIPVKTYSVQETVGTSGILTNANSVTEVFTPPASGGGQLTVELTPSLASSWASGLTFLKEYPYFCLEQTVSRFLPNLMASRVLKSLNSPPLGLQADLDAEVNAALQKIYAQQNGDGGWGWWGGYTSDPQTSAYIVMGLVEAEASGYTVRKSVLDNGVDFLTNNIDPLDRNAPHWKFNLQAFINYVLARAGSPQDSDMLFESRSSLGVYGEAFLALAMHEYNAYDPRIQTLLSDLNNAAVLSATGMHWEEKTAEDRDWNTNLRTTAIVLFAMIQLDPDDSLNASGVRWLMANRLLGYWGSTQETAWSIMALAEWLQASREMDTNYRFAIGLNGNLWKDGLFDRSNLADPIRLTVPLPSPSGGMSQFLVLARGEGAGNLYYTAYMTVTLPVASVEALDRGIIVSRDYFQLDDPKHPITRIDRGELVRVRLTVVASSDLYQVVVDDPLPAGLEAIDASLSGHVAIPTVYTVQDFDTNGWGWWYFDHQEVRDDKVVLSASYLPAGTYVYTYVARAGVAGTFNVIPATASEFYFPDVSGRSAGSLFIVTP